MDFYCSKCGQCCRSLNKSALYKDLDRGDGVCIYFLEKENLCSIYSNRPIICRVKESYSFFKEEVDYEAYIKLNQEICKSLKGEK